MISKYKAKHKFLPPYHLKEINGVMRLDRDGSAFSKEKLVSLDVWSNSNWSISKIYGVEHISHIWFESEEEAINYLGDSLG